MLKTEYLSPRNVFFKFLLIEVFSIDSTLLLTRVQQDLNCCQATTQAARYTVIITEKWLRIRTCVTGLRSHQRGFSTYAQQLWSAQAAGNAACSKRTNTTTARTRFCGGSNTVGAFTLVQVYHKVNPTSIIPELKPSPTSTTRNKRRRVHPTRCSNSTARTTAST